MLRIEGNRKIENNLFELGYCNFGCFSAVHCAIYLGLRHRYVEYGQRSHTECILDLSEGILDLHWRTYF